MILFHLLLTLVTASEIKEMTPMPLFLLENQKIQITRAEEATFGPKEELKNFLLIYWDSLNEDMRKEISKWFNSVNQERIAEKRLVVEVECLLEEVSDNYIFVRRNYIDYVSRILCTGKGEKTIAIFKIPQDDTSYCFGFNHYQRHLRQDPKHPQHRCTH